MVIGSCRMLNIERERKAFSGFRTFDSGSESTYVAKVAKQMKYVADDQVKDVEA